jgi:hypothetical protein
MLDCSEFLPFGEPSAIYFERMFVRRLGADWNTASRKNTETRGPVIGGISSVTPALVSCGLALRDAERCDGKLELPHVERILTEICLAPLLL